MNPPPANRRGVLVCAAPLYHRAGSPLPHTDTSILRTPLLPLTVSLVAYQPETPPKTAVDSRPVTLRDGSIPVSKALAEVRRQTGVLVADDRGDEDNNVSLNLDRASFWQAVDTIAASAKGRVVL